MRPIEKNLERLRATAREFRLAIEHLDRSVLPVTFENFPRGSCGDAVLLLGTYLLDNGYGEFGYVLGERGDHQANTWSSHTWLEKQNLVVDITADQFPEISDKVIVCLDSEWHRQFNGKIEHKADYRIYDSRTAASLNNVYNEILKYMQEHNNLLEPTP